MFNFTQLHKNFVSKWNLHTDVTGVLSLGIHGHDLLFVADLMYVNTNQFIFGFFFHTKIGGKDRLMWTCKNTVQIY